MILSSKLPSTITTYLSKTRGVSNNVSKELCVCHSYLDKKPVFNLLTSHITGGLYSLQYSRREKREVIHFQALTI